MYWLSWHYFVRSFTMTVVRMHLISSFLILIAGSSIVFLALVWSYVSPPAQVILLLRLLMVVVFVLYPFSNLIFNVEFCSVCLFFPFMGQKLPFLLLTTALLISLIHIRSTPYPYNADFYCFLWWMTMSFRIIWKLFSNSHQVWALFVLQQHQCFWVLHDWYLCRRKNDGNFIFGIVFYSMNVNSIH